jgi:hypothetical protein
MELFFKRRLRGLIRRELDRVGVFFLEVGLEERIIIEGAIDQENELASREQLFEMEEILKGKPARDDEDAAGGDVRFSVKF